MKSALAAMISLFVILMSSGIAFADVSGNAVDPNVESAQIAVEPDSAAVPAPAEAHPVEAQPVVAQPVAEPVVAKQPITIESNYDWEKDSLLYKRVGWSMFGSGLLVGGVVGGALLGSAIHDNKKMDGEGIGALGHGIANAMMGYVGIGIIAVGGAVMLSGIGVLIAEEVKFNPYRRGEIAGLEFEWSPELYVSPEFNGIGFSARF